MCRFFFREDPSGDAAEEHSWPLSPTSLTHVVKLAMRQVAYFAFVFVLSWSLPPPWVFLFRAFFESVMEA